jgi:N-methylhydantoinase A
MTATVAVDIGGTFTDVVLETGGRRVTTKTPTTPDAPAQGVMTGLACVLREAGLAPGDVGLVLHGTTLATNAILERKGAVTALVTTQGFRDVLEIGTETRHDQYDLMIDKPVPLVPRRNRLTVPERVDVSGAVRTPLDEAAVEALVPALDAAGVESVAVAFLHAYANPAHEQRTREILSARRPDLAITLSSEVSPEIREYERFSTASANAYVKPLMQRYLEDLQARLTAGGFNGAVLMITSGGGLCTLETAAHVPVRLVESGPAGGAIFAGTVAGALDLPQTLSFDMGGTTAKICLLQGSRPHMAREFEVDRSQRHVKGSGLPLRIPVIEMVEIGAGGGSIAALDAIGRITVGPQSAGAAPGPAAYDRGGTDPTVSDADVVLGRVPVERFAGGALTLRPDRAADALARTIGTPLGLDATGAAIGVSEMVDETMANAARRHTVERGLDASTHTLVAFGGAAPLHACRLARKLGIRRVVVPAHAGVGSAVGFLRAPVAFEQVTSLRMPLAAFDPERVNALFAGLREEALQVVRAGAPGASLTERRQAFMRYVGQGHEIAVFVEARDLGPDDAAILRAAFETAYARQFRRAIPGADIEVLSWGLSLEAERPAPRASADDARAPAMPLEPAGSARVVDAASGTAGEVPVYDRATLAPGVPVQGPALIAEAQTTTNVPRGFIAAAGPDGALILEDRS